MDINSKIAIVTGASSGVGAAFSQALVQKGAHVFGLARSEDKLRKVREKLGNSFEPVVMDVTDSNAVGTWAESTFDESHSPDILVNNAGVAAFAQVEELKIDDWEAMINTNLNGVFYLTRCIVPYMKNNENTCHIVNIASIAGLLGNPNLTGYNASKFGVRGFTEALFKEVRYDRIKVTGFYPGSIATDFFNKVGSETHPNMMKPEEVADVFINVLETPDNFLINQVVMRPLDPKDPEQKN